MLKLWHQQGRILNLPNRTFCPSSVRIALSVTLFILAGLSLLIGAGELSDAHWGSTFLQLRAMRVLAACLVGSGLAISGVMMQGLFRNPLADPGVIGTSAGAVLGGMVTVLISFLLGAGQVFPPVVLLPIGCVSGGLLSLWIVLMVARRASDNLSVLLAGVVLGMLFASVGAALNAWAQRDYELARSLMAFSFGSIDAKGLEHLLLATPLVLGGMWAAWRWAPCLDVLLSGEEEAASLGVDLERSRRWLIIWATLPVAGAVAIGGGIAFVGLVVPHLLRGLIGPLHRGLLPCAALGGAIFVLACDVLARSLPTQGEIPLGVISGLIGAPLFLILMVRTRQEAQF
jgi:iron complex transport system permease protein